MKVKHVIGHMLSGFTEFTEIKHTFEIKGLN